MREDNLNRLDCDALAFISRPASPSQKVARTLLMHNTRRQHWCKPFSKRRRFVSPSGSQGARDQGVESHSGNCE